MGCCCSTEPQAIESSRKVYSRKKRQCTDILPLAFFLAFWCGMGLVTAFAYLRGDAYRIINGSDSFGNTCGRSNAPLVRTANTSIDPVYFPFSGQNMTFKKFLFPLDVLHPFNSAWICVNECPNNDVKFNVETFHQDTNYSYCTPDISIDGEPYPRMCPREPIYQSDGSMLSRCIPNDLVTIALNMVSSLSDFVRSQDSIRGFVAEVIFVRDEILALCIFSVGLSLVVVFLIRYLASVIVYFIYVMVIILSSGICLYAWYGWYMAYMNGDGMLMGNETALTMVNQTDTLIALPPLSMQTLLICAIVMSIITVLLVVLVWCVWQRGALVVDLFRESGRALTAMPFLLLQPVFTCLFLILLLAYSAAVALMLYTAAPAVPSVLNLTNGEEMEVVTRNATSQLRCMGWYYLVGFVWTTEFIFACHRMVVAGAVAAWYFKRKSSSPWCKSLANLIHYHLGSVALGSFIITLVKLPRYVLMYLHTKLKGSDGFMAKYILRCFIVVLACVEKCLRYIHHNAYTVIAISGQSFCPASKAAVNLLLDNAVDVATINTVGDFVLFLAKCIVTAVCGSLAMLRFKIQLSLNYWLLLVGIVAVVAYIVASCFLSVIEMVVDTLFLCFAYDHDSVTKSRRSNDYADLHFKEYMNTTLDRERALCSERRWDTFDSRPVEQIQLARLRNGS